MITAENIGSAMRRAHPLVRLDVKISLAFATRQGVDLDAAETKLFAKHSLPLLREHIEHQEHPDEMPQPGTKASYARCRRALRRNCTVEQTHVYFVRRGNSGPIKIGMARDVERRFASLQTACPERLVLLAHSDRYDESDLHRFYRRERIRGEWFRASPRLLALVEFLSR